MAKFNEANREAKEMRAYILKEAEILTPVAQATADAYADVVGSKIDTVDKDSVAITTLNSDAANSLDWKVLGSIDDVSYVEVQAEATLAFGALGSYSVAQAPFRYYKVQVKSTVPATPSEATVSAIAKN